MRHLYNAIFILFCGFALVSCKYGSDILNVAISGHVDDKQPTTAVSTLSPILCKGDGTITCSCYNAGKTRAYFQWNGLSSLYTNYNNVELDSVFVLLSYSCSEGSPDLWNGIDLYQVNGGSFNKQTLTWNNQPALSYIAKLTTWQIKLDLSVMDAVLKRGDYSFAIALDSGNVTENLSFYGMSQPNQATLAIYARCKPGWAFDGDGQCTVATPLPPVTPPTTPPVTPPVATPVNPPTTPPVTTPVAVPVAIPVSVPVTVPQATPVTSPVAGPITADTPSAVPTVVNSPPVVPPITNEPVSNPTSDASEPLNAPVSIEAPIASSVPTKISVPQVLSGIVSAAPSHVFSVLSISIMSLVMAIM